MKYITGKHVTRNCQSDTMPSEQMGGLGRKKMIKNKKEMKRKKGNQRQWGVDLQVIMQINKLSKCVKRSDLIDDVI